jgi:methanogenic corrinoid protein MtbC1
LITLEALAAALIELDEEQTLRLTKEILTQGDATALSILAVCQQALRVVGERYERGEYYLSGLMMGGELFMEVLDLAQPSYQQTASEESSGTILLGTVARDIHDIGKDIFGVALRGFGFKVIDLGVDVPKESFLEEVRRSRPDVVCLSGLVAAAFRSMKETVSILRANATELGYTPPIVIGGGTVSGEVCQFVDADSWSTDAMEGVRICQRLVGGGLSQRN